MTTPVDLQADWGFDFVAVVCPNCDWNYLTSELSTRLCPHCSQAQLEQFELDTEQLASVMPPEQIVQYRVGREQMTRIVEAFSKDIPYPPNDLNPESLSQRVQRVYLPMWLVDGKVRAQWEAQAGYNYQVESHKSSYSGGQWRTQKVYETRVEWEDRVGQLQRNYDNISAPALEEHRQLMYELGNYNLSSAQNYTSEAVRRALVRLPNRSTDDAFSDAKEGFRLRAADDIKQATEAENVRDFRWRAGYQNLNWTQLLLPVYMTYYQDDTGTHRVIYINGETGQPAGERRGSMKRTQRILAIGLTVTAILATIAIVMVLLNPANDDNAAVIAIIAMVIGIGSLTPILQVWRYNTRQENQANQSQLATHRHNHRH